MTAVMSSEVASNASNLLMDIKPGYMLGAKPRQQAIGHVIGIIAGALAATPLFFLLFLSRLRRGRRDHRGRHDGQREIRVPRRAAVEGRVRPGDRHLRRRGRARLADHVDRLLDDHRGFAALVMEILRMRTHNRFPLSPLAIGLGVVVPPDSTLMMFLRFAALLARMRAGTDRSRNRAVTRSGSTRRSRSAPGLIAGAALIGIGDILVRVFVLS